MATVPYNPVPQEVASGALSEQHPRVSEAAFGGEIGRAISGLGKTVEGVGDAVFERAKWLQNLHNTAEARKADAEYITASGQLTAEFNSLEGDNAVKAYPQYQKRLKVLRESIRSGLTTGAAQEMYDGQTLGTLSRAVFSGAQTAAKAQKAFTIQSMEAQRTAITEEAARYPQDNLVTERAVRRIQSSVDEEGRLRGMPPEAIDNAKNAATSKIYANQIETLAKEYPLQGPAEFEKLRGKLTLADAKRVENVVNNQRDAYGTAKIATDIVTAHTDEDGNLNRPVDELTAEVRRLAKTFSPDDPGFETKAVRAFQSELHIRKSQRKQENYDNRDVLNQAIITGDVKSMDQLLTNPTASAAYYALPKSEQLKIPGRIYNYHKARDREYNEVSFNTIMGNRNNDVEAFLNLEPTDEKYKLSQGQIRQVQEAQDKAKRSTAQDPRVSRAMGWLKSARGTEMEALGVYSRTQRNKDDYDHLTGTVQQALDLWIEDHKKPPTQAEFNEKIAPSLLKIRKEPGMFGIYGGPFGSDRPFFKFDTSSRDFKDFVVTKKEEFITKGAEEPSEHELYRLYARKELLKLFPAKSKTSSGIGSK
jgi:hypothetical protein